MKRLSYRRKSQGLETVNDLWRITMSPHSVSRTACPLLLHFHWNPIPIPIPLKDIYIHTVHTYIGDGVGID